MIKPDFSLFGGKFNSDQIDSLLNSYGQEGWELVSVSGSHQDFGSTKCLFFFMKRPKNN